MRFIGRNNRRRFPFGPTVLLIGLVTIAGCSGAGKSPQRAPRTAIDAAIALFVSGEYEQAIASLDELAGSTESEEQLREVYTYLGRAHLALGQHNQAIDAFSAGVSYGDTGACVEYLEQLGTYVEGGERSVRRSDELTRRQLASALARRFVFDNTAPGATETQAELDAVLTRGWMQNMPDGSFHGDEPVTRAAFLVAVSRVVAGLGYGGTVIAPLRESFVARGREPITGAEVTALLDELVTLGKRYGG